MKRAVAFLLLLAMPVLSAGQADTRAVRPEIRVGDSWTYRSTNILGPGTVEHVSRVSFVDDKAILLVSTRKDDGKEFDSSWTLDWNAVTSYTGFIYRPSTKVFNFPLRIGDQHKIQIEVIRPKSNVVVAVATGNSVVVGWETIAVPAGTFRAIRVDTDNLNRSLDGGSTFRLQGTFWYQPEVRRWVKFQVVGPQMTVSEELIEYKLNED